MVNRLWKHHFGSGIVKTLGNFGKAGALPTHPELLDWLAIEFVQRGWSIKAMHRLMMNSATYRQRSDIDEARQRLDPNNQLYSRMPMLRLDAEALYDSMLAVSGSLNESRFGPPVGLDVRADGLATPVATAGGWRRLIYVQQQRKVVATHLESFDYPQMNPNCVQRRDSLVAPQALYMLNNKMVYDLAERLALRVAQESTPSTGPTTQDQATQQIDRLYRIALSRPPSPEELRITLESLDRLSMQLSHTASPNQGLIAICHALLNSAAFLYVD
jgi:hypothetical protein